MSAENADSVRGMEHDGCPYFAVQVPTGEGPHWFCNKCGWGAAAENDGSVQPSTEARA